MLDFIARQEATVYEFYQACEKKRDTGNTAEKHFISLLSASAA